MQPSILIVDDEQLIRPGLDGAAHGRERPGKDLAAKVIHYASAEERSLVVQALRRSEWNQTQAAACWV